MILDIDKRENNSIAIIDNSGIEITYGQICEFTNKMLKLIGSRELIFIICENSSAAFAGYLGCLSINTVPLMLSSSISMDILSKLIEIYSPAYFWIPNEMRTKFSYDVIFDEWNYSLIKTGLNSPKMSDLLALLLPTSGSTGSPKLVRHTLNNIISNAKAVSDVFELNCRSRGMVSLPINFTQGLNVATSHIYVGGTVLLSKATLTQKEFWEFIKDKKAESFTGVPYSYELLRKINFFKMDLPYLKVINQGGGRMTDELFLYCVEYAIKTNRKFIATYGSTETTSRMAYLPAVDAIRKIGSIGKAMPGCKLLLKDYDNKIINEENMEGEIVFEGPNVTMGYAENKDDLLLNDERNGVYNTGDLAYFDKEGYFFITGRKARFLKLYGYRISLDEIERIIKSEFNCNVACVGNDDNLFAYIEQEEVGLKEKIIAKLAEITKLPKNTFKIVQIDNIPKADNGKTQYSKLNELVAKEI